MAAPAALQLDLDALREAARALDGLAIRTPLEPVPALTDRAGVPVHLKREDRQPMGAFKQRGACLALGRLPADVRARGVITYSSGNHGQAVAWAARHYGVRAVIVMPETAPAVKVKGVRSFGGEVVFAPPTSVARREIAERMAADEGLTIIPPFDDAAIMTGQGTVGLEILDELPDVGTIVVPVGGGGLLAGICLAVEASGAAVAVWGVEPEGAAKLTAAWEAGAPVALERTGSVADGLLPLSIGTLTFPVIRRVARGVATVPDEAIEEAVRVLARDAGVRAEPSGAATTAALLAGRVPAAGPTVLVVSGGNVDDAVYDRITGAG